MKQMNKEVKKYFEDLEIWKRELIKLRKFILECGLKEEYKWRNPCYTNHGKNIVLIGASKSHCLLSFFKGVLLKDQENILQKIGQHTRSAKYIAFESLDEVITHESIIKDYIQEAIDIEKKGLKVDYSEDQELNLPLELVQQFAQNPMLKSAFFGLTKGRQRGYILYFSNAKQSQTRTRRINKYKDRILTGKGMLDCICGLSERMPNCDGSHNRLNQK